MNRRQLFSLLAAAPLCAVIPAAAADNKWFGNSFYPEPNEIWISHMRQALWADDSIWRSTSEKPYDWFRQVQKPFALTRGEWVRVGFTDAAEWSGTNQMFLNLGLSR